MRNVFFPEEQVTADDLYFTCFMVEKVARQLKQPNKYVVNAMGHDELAKKISLADGLHSDNPLSVAADWIEEYHLQKGDYDVSKVNQNLCPKIPTETQMGKVYKRLVLNTLQSDEDYADGIVRVYNSPICETLDNYSCGAYYEPSPYIARSFFAGGF